MIQGIRKLRSMTYSKETHQKQKKTQCLLNKPKFVKVVGIKDGQLLHKLHRILLKNT